MEEKTITIAMDLITQLAEKMGTTAEYLMGIFVAQAPISSACTMVYLGCAMLVVVLLMLITYSVRDDDGAPFFFGLLSTVGFLVILCYSLKNCGRIASGFWNPEYWAITEILSMIK